MVVREIRTAFMVVEVSIGLALNAVLIRLINRHTPHIMSVYSKILLQTCITDILLLIMTALGDEIYLSTRDGTGCWNNGILQWIGLGSYNPLSLFVSFCWSFLINEQIFLFCAQYIYRYLTLSRGKDISTRQYLAMAAAFSIVPFIFDLGIIHTTLRVGEVPIKDTSFADILGLNISSRNISYFKLTPNGDQIMLIGFYYTISVTTIAYIILIVLGWRMHRFVKRELEIAQSGMKKSAKLNSQFTRTLLIQAPLPFFLVLSLTFTLVMLLFRIDLGGLAKAMPYYTALSPIPMYTPAMLNPLVAIIVITPYRRAFLRKFANGNVQVHTQLTSQAMEIHSMRRPSKFEIRRESSQPQLFEKRNSP